MIYALSLSAKRTARTDKNNTGTKSSELLQIHLFLCYLHTAYWLSVKDYRIWPKKLKSLVFKFFGVELWAMP